MRLLGIALSLALVAPAASTLAPSPAAARQGGSPPTALVGSAGVGAVAPAPARVTAAATPALDVRRQVTGLDHPWDVQEIGDGRLLITERSRPRLDVWEGGTTTRVDFPEGSVWVSGETGLMSLEVAPDFATTGRFYTCQGAPTAGGGHDVRVVAWRYDDAARSATRVRDLLTGLPSRTGRHGGCRLLLLRDGSMVVGTGDAAVGTNPRNLRSLGGKTLRLDPATGAPWPGNPFVGAANRNKRYVQTYGHRNVQGLGQRRDGSVWSVEQGTYRDDEVNRLRPGGDYGYHPVPGYNEKVPMTNPRLPGPQVAARWRSGDPTIAASGGSWVYGKQWGALDGTFAVAALKAQRVVFLRFDAAGRLQSTSTPAALRQFGRLRSITQAADGDLLVTTDNGNGTDAVLRVSPRP
jgi:glucose/arabinose dehydrogenase